MNRRTFLAGAASIAAASQISTQACFAADKGWKNVASGYHISGQAVEHIESNANAADIASWSTDGGLLLQQSLEKNKHLVVYRENCRLISVTGHSMYFTKDGATTHYDLKTAATSPYELPFTPVVFSQDGQWMAGLRSGQLPAVRNQRTGTITTLGAPNAIYQGEWRLFSFSYNGKWLVVAQGVRAYLFDLSKPDDPITLPDMNTDVRQVDISNDGRVVVMGGLDGQVYFYDRLRQKVTRELKLEGDLRSIAIDPINSLVLFGLSTPAKSLQSVPLPPVKERNQMPPAPVLWPNNDECWSVWIRGKVAVTGHLGGKLKLWKMQG